MKSRIDFDSNKLLKDFPTDEQFIHLVITALIGMNRCKHPLRTP